MVRILGVKVSLFLKLYTLMCCSIQVEPIGGNKYFVSFIDDYIRKLWVYLIKKKSDVLDVFIKFKSMVER
jgi:hypothetical protein